MGSPIDQKGFEFGMEIVNYRSSGHRFASERLYERASKRNIGILLDLEGDTGGYFLIFSLLIVDIRNAIKKKNKESKMQYGISCRDILII